MQVCGKPTEGWPPIHLAAGGPVDEREQRNGGMPNGEWLGVVPVGVSGWRWRLEIGDQRSG
jgi:hypothetical protein